MKEIDLLRQIAFSIAMIDPWDGTEHDDVLFDDAHGKARIWQEKFNTAVAKDEQ